MRLFLLLLFFVLWGHVFSQNIKIEKNIVYGTAADWKSQKRQLKMDLFTPVSEKSLPLIVFIHGGAFYSGDKDQHTAFCSLLAQRGYIVANINYRLGFDTSAAKKDAGVLMACYRAAQDASSALRYLMHDAQKNHIDTSSVFLSGESAGAVTSLAEAYISQQQWDGLFPFLHQSLGGVNESGNQWNAPYRLRGIISLWGGILDTALISSAVSRKIPIELFQSESDSEIPYQHSKGQKNLYSSLYGSFDIAQYFFNSGSCAQLYYTKDARHFFGYSHHYVVGAIKSFIDDVLNGRCKNLMKENIGERNDLPFSDYQ